MIELQGGLSGFDDLGPQSLALGDYGKKQTQDQLVVRESLMQEANAPPQAYQHQKAQEDAQASGRVKPHD
ncbi:MAG: hypothetical protein HY922_08110 [Elusimicrobia bacterium]|nr:hypothetical protein [Elusimicrobiota bacterium]